MKLSPEITLVPILHGKLAMSSYVRQLCNTNSFDCIVLDLPEPLEEHLSTTVSKLPYISAITLQSMDSQDGSLFFLPTDPCDPAIEGVRQAQQNRLPCVCIGYPELFSEKPLPPLPDAHVIDNMGFEEYATLCLSALKERTCSPTEERSAQYSAYKLHQLRSTYSNILALVHFRHIIPLCKHFNMEKTHNLTFPVMQSYRVHQHIINPDHLYFALGELPFITGISESERYDPFAQRVTINQAIKDLFCQTRDNYFETKEDTLHLSPVRIQRGLTFLRNLSIMDKSLSPTLFDIITTAKGIGGNQYALNILKCAKYYPYLPIEESNDYLSIGIDKIIFPQENEALPAINILKDYDVVWKTISIKPDPSELRKKKYRYAWNPFGMCSHLPEDRKIELFNTHVRAKAQRALSEDLIKTEKFESSVKDGVDMRETIRNWHTGNIYVKEIPPSRGTLDTVVIIFDDGHDENYPQHATWYAEHNEESTLTFYSTDPFSDMIGPGIARCTYGGLSLLFPPRPIPCAFELSKNIAMKKLSHRLTYGALLFSKERTIAYIAEKKPDLFIKRMAAKLKKRIVWVPMASFSAETIRKLRRFHVLNGKEVRSWASRFIGE